MACVVVAGMGTASAESRSIPSVIVTVKNSAPSRGAFQTPFWIGAHDGMFDIYDRDVALGDLDANPNLVPVPAVERLAEDGNTAPISEAFTNLQPNAPQETLMAPSGPFAPGERSATTLNVDPTTDRYFSYASMVIPSNDAFVANGNPKAHELFDASGRFVAQNFAVAGNEILDAGTEVNDELSAHTAFLNQTGPDAGEVENGVITLHPGFRDDVPYADGILTRPVFAGADFAKNDNYRVATFSFRYVDLGNRVRFQSLLSPRQEVTASLIESDGRGKATIVSYNAEHVTVDVRFRRLTGQLMAAHLHMGPKGVNGPVVVDLGSGIENNTVRFTARAEDITGPLAESDDPVLYLVRKMASGNIYINLHTADNPGGEIRGQVWLPYKRRLSEK